MAYVNKTLEMIGAPAKCTMQFLIAKIRVELPERHLLGVGIEIHKDSSFV